MFNIPLLSSRRGGAPPAPETDYLAEWINGATYADFDARFRLWQDAAGTTPATANADKVGRSVDGSGAFVGTQSTANSRPTLSISGSRYELVGDGSDDNLLTDWYASPTDNSVFVDATIPPTLADTKLLFGLTNGSGERLIVGVDTSGRLIGGVHSRNQTSIFGTTNFLGQRLVGVLSHNATTIKLFTLSGGEELSLTPFGGAGSPTQLYPARILASNFTGNVNSPFQGGVARIVAVHRGGLTLDDWLNIGPQFAAGTSLAG